MLLTACGGGAERDAGKPGGVLFVYLEMPASQVKKPEAVDAVIERMELLRRPFLELHPSVRIQFIPFAEERLLRQVRRRNWDGLGPDLLLVTDQTARELRRLGLTAPAQAPGELLEQLDPVAVERLREDDGQLAGLPVLLQTEQACFNRSLMADSPATLEGLLQASAAGATVGLNLEPIDLAWLLGTFAADGALTTANQGRMPDPQQRLRLVEALEWLAQANLQARVSMFTKEEPMLDRFSRGELAWIPCRSDDLARLRRSLGDDLGVAGLPRGPGGEPTPVNRLRVWAFGTNSSARQRSTAERWAQFSLTPGVQRRLTLQTEGNLPTNLRLPVPVESSAILRTLEETRQQVDAAEVEVTLRLLDGEDNRQIRRLITDAAFQTISPQAASSGLLEVLMATAGGPQP